MGAHAGAFTVVLTASPSASPTDALFGLSSGPAGTYADLAAIVRFNPAGRVDARNGGGYTADHAWGYAAGSPFHLALDVDTISHTYTVRIADDANLPPLATHYAFRTEQAGTGELDNLALKVDDAGSLSVCNISVTPSRDCRTAVPSGGFVNRGFESQPIAFRASFKATAGASGIDGVVGLSPRQATAFADLAAAVRFNPDGFIDVRRGAEYAADLQVPYVAGQTYAVDMLVDVLGHSYAVGVDGNVIARNYPFRTQQAAAPALSDEAVIVDSPAGKLTVCDFTAVRPAPLLYQHDTLRYGSFSSPASLSALNGGGLLMATDTRTLTLDAKGDKIAETPHGGTIAQDGAGNIYLFGRFEGTYDGGGGPLASAGGFDVYVSKYDAGWHPAWTRRLGGPDDDGLASPSVDAAGNVAMLIGSYNVEQGSSTVLMIRLNPDGSTASSAPSSAGGVALTPDAGLLVTGGGPGGLTVSRLDSSGALVWTRTFPAEGADFRVIRSDASGSAIIGGEINGTIDFGARKFTARAGEDGSQAFVAKLDPAGAYVYATVATMHDLRDVVVDAAGNAIISGTKVNAFRPRLNEIDPTGNIVFGADEELVAPFLFGFGGSVAVDTSGHVYWMLSGGGNLSGSGVGYLVKLAPEFHREP